MSRDNEYTPAWAKQSDEVEETIESTNDDIVVEEELSTELPDSFVTLVADNIEALDNAEPEPMFWDNVAPDNEPGLFQEQDVEEFLQPGWAGWLDKITSTPLKRAFRHNNYFDALINAKAFKSLEHALQHAEEIASVSGQFWSNGAAGDTFENSLVATYGLEAEAFKERYSDALLDLYNIAWRMGYAVATQKVKASLYTSATKGNLDAQKTVLRNVGELDDETSLGKLTGQITFAIDSEDAQA